MNKILDIKNMRSKLLPALLSLLYLISLSAFAQSDWKVEDAKSKITNPVQADDASIKEGKILFKANCKSCHGDPGKNNGLPLVPIPTDFANAAFLSLNSDGAIFTKMTEGRVVMPAFKAVLSETQRWQIVNYIRSFDINKVVEVAQSVKTGTTDSNLVAPYQITLNYLAESNKLTALVEGTNKQGAWENAANVEVGFFIERYFGDLPFGEIGGVTDQNGIIEANIPVDLPGGEEGKAIAYAVISETNTFGNVKAKTEVNVKPVEITNPLDERTLWTVRVMAPWWLIFTYFGILIGVWTTLAYVVSLLFKLKKAGL